MCPRGRSDTHLTGIAIGSNPRNNLGRNLAVAPAEFGMSIHMDRCDRTSAP